MFAPNPKGRKQWAHGPTADSFPNLTDWPRFDGKGRSGEGRPADDGRPEWTDNKFSRTSCCIIQKINSTRPRSSLCPYPPLFGQPTVANFLCDRECLCVCLCPSFSPSKDINRFLPFSRALVTFRNRARTHTYKWHPLSMGGGKVGEIVHGEIPSSPTQPHFFVGIFGCNVMGGGLLWGDFTIDFDDRHQHRVDLLPFQKQNCITHTHVKVVADKTSNIPSGNGGW